MTDIAALLPGAERFDGHGGAIATWVRETYARSEHSTIVASPRATRAYAGRVEIAQTPAYDLYENCLRTTSTLLAPRISKSFQVVYNRLLFDRFWVKSALRRIENAKLVHIHNRPHYAKMLRDTGYGGRVVLHMHNDLRSYVTREQADDVFPYLDGIAFCSEFVMDRAVEAFGAIPRPFVVPNGVDASQIDRSLSRPGTAPLKLVYAGRIMPEKGPLEAVKVCAELRSRGHDAQIDLVGATGSGVDNSRTRYLDLVEEAVRELNRSAGGEVARLLGPRAHSEVFRLFAEGDLFVLPCDWEEPFGMVALEAMSKGCVPFVSNRGGLPDVVRGGGVVIDLPAHAAKSVAHLFVDAIEEHADETVLARLREHGWDRAEQLTWESVTTITDREFDGVLRA